MKITKNQKSLMEHAISGPNRNWFGTSLGYSDSNEFEKLIEMGLAYKSDPPSWSGDDVLYHLTEEGKNILK